MQDVFTDDHNSKCYPVMFSLGISRWMLYAMPPVTESKVLVNDIPRVRKENVSASFSKG